MKERQRQILGILHEAPRHVTAGQLALRLNCSERTVRSDIGELRDLLAESGTGRLEAKGNQGYRLEATPEEWKRLLSMWEDLARQTALDTRLGGRWLVLERLLKTGAATIAGLERELFTNYKSVRKYVDEAEEWLRAHDVALLRRRGQGFSLQGSRHQIRLALWALYREMTALPREEPRDDGLQRFWQGIDLTGVRQAVSRLERDYQFRLSYGSYERLCFLLAAMLADSRKKLPYRFPGELPAGPAWEREAGRDALELIRDYYHAALPDEEGAYIWFALASSEIMDFLTGEALARNAGEKSGTLALVRGLVRMIGDILQRRFTGDEILENGLLNCLSALGTALRWGDRTGESGGAFPFQSGYADVAVACWSASHLLEDFLGAAVTEWEVNTIAVHFAGAVEREDVGGTVYVVCSYGVGVSRFLCEQLKRAFPRVQVLGELTPRDLRALRAPARRYDLLITTVDLPDLPEEATVRIGNYLRSRDIEAIKKKLARLHARAEEAPRPELPGSGCPLFEAPLILHPKGPQDKAALLHQMCELLERREYVSGEFEASVLERERNSSTVLSPQVAIPHGLPDYVRVSRAAAALLDTPLSWNGSERVDTVFLLAFNFKNGAGVQRSVVGFYKGLIAMLNEPERLASLRSLPDAQAVADALNAIAK